MYRRAFARYQTGAALLLGLSLRAPSASAEPDETRVGTVEGKAAVPYLYQLRFGPSVIHQGSIDRPEPAFSGDASVRLFDVGGRIETSFARGLGRLLPALLSLLGPEVKLDSRDYQARRTYESSARDRFSVFSFGSYDPLGEKSNSVLTRLGDACRPKITFTW